jgi:hypothetical protein
MTPLAGELCHPDRKIAAYRATPLAVSLDARVTDHIVRVGLNYKFDPNEIWADY